MRRTNALPALLLLCSLGGCASSSTTLTPQAPPLPPASTNGPVPASVTAVKGYSVTVFAAKPKSTKPDSLVQVGTSVFVGYGDTVSPDGTPGAGGKSQTEVLQYDLSGKLLKTYEVAGHNDGLMKYDGHTLWAMSNEDANPKLVVIDTLSGTQQTYSATPALLNASGGLPHGGGLDDMQLIGGKVFVSGSNATVNAAAACASNSSTAGCPNGVVTAPYVYTLSLNAAGTFNLTPVVSSNTPTTNRVTGTIGTFNITDADSETVAPDGSTLIIDGQQDAELAFVSNAASIPTQSYLPLTLGGAPQQVDDTRFVPGGPTFLLLADTPSNTVYRIDGAFPVGAAYSAGETMLLKLDLTSGAFTPIVSGLQAPHGLLFVRPQ